jgi:hypothetical protein
MGTSDRTVGVTALFPRLRQRRLNPALEVGIGAGAFREGVSRRAFEAGVEVTVTAEHPNELLGDDVAALTALARRRGRAVIDAH